MSTGSHNSNLFIAPPPPRSYDPINPNPLVTYQDIEECEHFALISRATIEEMRLLGCQIIQSGVRLLKMSQSSLYTSQILFNQFFACRSFLDYPLIDVVMACVFVAGKVEECIRRARDIVNVFHHIYCLIRNLPAHPIDYVGDTYYIWRDRLCTTESFLLRELGFHVQPASPVGLLLSYMKILEITADTNSNHHELQLSQVALNFLNDALKTNAYVLFQPRILAVSAISLALDRLDLNFLLPSPLSITAPWFSLFDVNESELEVCKNITMTIYKRELDTLLPLVKEELAIFSQSIKNNCANSQDIDITEHRVESHARLVDKIEGYSNQSITNNNRNDYNRERNLDDNNRDIYEDHVDRDYNKDHSVDYNRKRTRDYSRDRERYHSRDNSTRLELEHREYSRNSEDRDHYDSNKRNSHKMNSSSSHNSHEHSVKRKHH